MVFGVADLGQPFEITLIGADGTRITVPFRVIDPGAST
jgi:hypothetical protein